MLWLVPIYFVLLEIIPLMLFQLFLWKKGVDQQHFSDDRTKLIEDNTEYVDVLSKKPSGVDSEQVWIKIIALYRLTIKIHVLPKMYGTASEAIGTVQTEFKDEYVDPATL